MRLEQVLSLPAYQLSHLENGDTTPCLAGLLWGLDITCMSASHSNHIVNGVAVLPSPISYCSLHDRPVNRGGLLRQEIATLFRKPANQEGGLPLKNHLA